MEEKINKVFEDIENGRIDNAVFSCIRLARSLDDKFNTLIFLKELRADSKQYNQSFIEEVNSLNKEASDYLWESVNSHWLEGRMLSFNFTDNPDMNVLVSGVGELLHERDSLKSTIIEMKAPAGMNPYDQAAFTDRYDNYKSQLRLKLQAVNTIVERIRTRCFNYVSRIEKQIKTQEVGQNYFIQIQSHVNNYFSSRSEDAYLKLKKATDLLSSSDPEDSALLLASTRRALHSVTDYFYPPNKGEQVCADGQKRLLGNEQYINRLFEFVNVSFKKSTSTELLKAELEYLMSYVTRINEIASKGVHSNVTSGEAKQGIFGLYLFLYNAINRLDSQ